MSSPATAWCVQWSSTSWHLAQHPLRMWHPPPPCAHATFPCVCACARAHGSRFVAGAACSCCVRVRVRVMAVVCSVSFKLRPPVPESGTAPNGASLLTLARWPWLGSVDRLQAKPKLCPNAAYEMMQRCWSVDPQERPAFSQIAPVLRAEHAEVH